MGETRSAVVSVLPRVGLDFQDMVFGSDERLMGFREFRIVVNGRRGAGPLRPPGFIAIVPSHGKDGKEGEPRGARPHHGLAPESALRLLPSIALSSAPVSSSVTVGMGSPSFHPSHGMAQSR